MPKVHLVKKARKAILSASVNVGDSYYYWEFRHGGRQVSKIYPKRSQLTQSGYLISIYDIEDRISNASSEVKSIDDFDKFKQEIIDELITIKDECEEKLENIPKQLREGNVGSLLQDRIDALATSINEMESVECLKDEDEKIEEVLSEAIEELTNAMQCS